MSSFRNHNYVDLNIPIGTQCRAVCETAINLGFKVLALNTPILAKNINGSSKATNPAAGTSKKAGKKRKFEDRSSGILASTAASIGKASGDSVPVPFSADWIPELCNSSTNPAEHVRILQRLTIIFDDVKDLHTVMSHENTNKYDILAVIPTTHDALLACIISTSLNFDIISFDFEGPYWIKKLKLNRVKGDLAASKGVVFEITYSSALHGDTAMENLVYATHNLLEQVCVKRIKNLIISSGAASIMELKGPKDVVSLAFLTGLDETTTRHCIKDYAHRTVDKAGNKTSRVNSKSNCFLSKLRGRVRVTK